MADEPIPPAVTPDVPLPDAAPVHLDPPVPSSVPEMTSMSPADRSADIQKAAEAGRLRSEREAARKIAMKQAKVDALKQDQSAMKEELEKKEEEQQKKKQFRAFKKEQEREIAEDKLRREKQSALILAAQKEREARRKVQQKYMDELHENARIKQAMEQKQNILKAEMEKERARAEHDYRRKLDEAERLCVNKKEQAEKDARAKKSVEQNDLKARLYQEESHSRSKMAAYEMEVRRMEQTPFRTVVDRERAMVPFRAQMKIKKKKIEDEHRERREELERATRQKESEIDGVMYSRKTQADTDLRQAIRMLDNELARKYNDIELNYRKRLGESKL